MDFQLGQQVRCRREKLAISQEKLARQAGLSRNYISLIERGRARNVSMRIISRIALALGTEPREFFDPADQDSCLIPPPLHQFALAEGLSYETVDRLARIPRRDQEPRTAEAWRGLFEAVRPYLFDPADEPTATNAKGGLLLCQEKSV